MKPLPPNEKPTASEVGQLRAYLAQNGVPPHVANELVKMARTRRKNADAIRAWCNNQE